MVNRVTGTVRLDDQLCFALYAATNAVTRAYRPLLARLDLTYPQYLVMMVLWQEDEVPAKRIAERLQLGPSAVTPLLGQLERAGYLMRRASPADKRHVLIAPTAAGIALEAAAAPAQNAVECRTGIDDADLAALRMTLHELIDRMRSDEKVLTAALT